MVNKWLILNDFILSSSNSDSDCDDSATKLNEDFVDYVGQQTSDKIEDVKFQPNNGKKKKKFQQWIPEQVGL